MNNAWCSLCDQPLETQEELLYGVHEGCADEEQAEHDDLREELDV
jgi:hypothetical protein